MKGIYCIYKILKGLVYYFNFLIMKTFLKFLFVLLALDFLAFLMWGFSGQFPQDSFYIGAITRNILITLL